MDISSTLRRLAGLPILLFLIAGILSAPSGQAAALAPSVALNPNSGPAPEVNGSLSGSGWTCSSGSPTTPTVSGNGATGSASISRVGGLSGSFIVMGSPGDHVTVTVSSSCPGIVPVLLKASAVFIFDSPSPVPTDTPTDTPTSTATPTETPTFTPTSAATPAATATSTPTPAAAPSGPTATPTPTAAPTPGPGPVTTNLTSTLTFFGCTPDDPEVMLSFVPALLLDPAGETAPPPNALLVPAMKDPADPHRFKFEEPPTQPATIYLVKPQYDDPDCPDSSMLDPTPWNSGHAIDISNIYQGTYKLEICEVIDKQPCEYIQIKGSDAPEAAPAATESSVDVSGADAYVTEMTYYPGDLGTRTVQYFRFTTDFPDPDSLTVQLQASLWPFPTGQETDPYAPPGLIAHWDVDCADCEFPVDLSVLDPEGAAAAANKKAKPVSDKSWYQPVVNVVTAPADGAAEVYKAIAGLFGGGGKKETEAPAGARPVGGLQEPPLNQGLTNPILIPKKYYFRVVMYKSDKADSWGSDNFDTLQEIPKPDPIQIKITPTVPPEPPAYKTEIISYNGIIPRLVQDKYPCFVVVEEAWPAKPLGLTYTTNQADMYPGSTALGPGYTFCKPEPKMPSPLETVLGWIEDGINWTSEAWQDIKDFAVDVILEFTPLGQQCQFLESTGTIPAGTCQQAFSIVLDAALASMGIPPDLPNFDQLMSQGIEYLATEAAAQVSIPPEVVKAATEQGGPLAGMALDAAEQELRDQLKDAMKDKMQASIKQIQLSYGNSISWVPVGLPVRPDEDQPPAAIIRVTRLQGVAGGENGCTAVVTDSLKMPAEPLLNPPPGWESAINGLPHELSPAATYDFFINEADLGSQGFFSGPDKEFVVPPLAEGESIDIPMTFKPNIYKNGWSPLGTISVNQYFNAWNLMHEFGTINLHVSGCGTDDYMGPAKSVFKK